MTSLKQSLQTKGPDAAVQEAASGHIFTGHATARATAGLRLALRLLAQGHGWAHGAAHLLLAQRALPPQPGQLRITIQYVLYFMEQGPPGRPRLSRGGPYEWNVITRFIMWKMSQRKGLKWVQDHRLNFADDWHISWTGHTDTAIYRAVKEAAEILAMLEDHGFEINLAKSAAVIKLAGPRLRSFNRNYIARRKEDLYLKCSLSPDKTYWIPVASKYKNFEADTVQRRLCVAEHAWQPPNLACKTKGCCPQHWRDKHDDVCRDCCRFWAQGGHPNP